MESETGLELYLRLRKSSISNGLGESFIPKEMLTTRNIIEIRGPSGSGKTVLLTELIANVIASVGEAPANAVLIIIDHHFDIRRLAHRVRTLLMRSRKFPDVDRSTLEALRRLVIHQCFSYDDLLLALYNLEEGLLSAPETSTIFIDSVTSFYWLARTDPKQAPTREMQYYIKLSALISRISKQYSISFVFTCQDLQRNHNKLSKELNIISWAIRGKNLSQWRY